MANNTLLSVIIGLSIPFLIILLLIIRKKAPKLWWLLKAKFSKKTVINELKTEAENAKKHTYTDFKEFLLDCPKYAIDDTVLGRMMRKIKIASGAKFQQFVFVDVNDPSDETVWLRKHGESLIHDGGTYVMPTKSEKRVQYYLKNDMRPLFDTANDPDWCNPDAVAEVVTALRNTANMEAMKRGATGNEGISKYYIAALAISVVIGIILLGFMYQYDKANAQTVEMMKLIINQTTP